MTLHVRVNQTNSSSQPASTQSETVIGVVARLAGLVEVIADDPKAPALVGQCLRDAYGDQFQNKGTQIGYRYIWCPDTGRFIEVCCETATFAIDNGTDPVAVEAESQTPSVSTGMGG